jgi:energy-converting hydrogenase Eha subunit A
MRFRPSIAEIFFLETAGWLAVWLVNDYVATLLTLVVSAIVFAVLVIALLAEAIERSKVPRRYFAVMAVSVVAPLVAAGIYVWLFEGRLAFLE